MTKRKQLQAIDLVVISFLRRWYLPVARFSLFLIFFWFGALKVLGLSPASPLAEALTARTVGMEYFDMLFLILSLFECLIGILFLIPKATRIVVPLLIVHMILVCSPLVLVPDMTWTGFLVPTLEGQYIIKNAAVVALALGIASHTKPLLEREK
jgi:uncharacterized membrane protein YkgB